MSNVWPGVVGAGTPTMPSAEWFNLPLLPAIAVAGTPGTPDNAAMAWYGRINVPWAVKLSAIHLHLDVDGTGGSWDLEVYRYRPSDGTHTLIASVSLASGGGDNGFKAFTFVSDELQNLAAGDYIRLQATAKMTGAATVGFVDTHFHAIPTRS
jgi:hypothetical protein